MNRHYFHLPFLLSMYRCAMGCCHMVEHTQLNVLLDSHVLKRPICLRSMLLYAVNFLPTMHNVHLIDFLHFEFAFSQIQMVLGISIVTLGNMSILVSIHLQMAECTLEIRNDFWLSWNMIFFFWKYIKIPFFMQLLKCKGPKLVQLIWAYSLKSLLSGKVNHICDETRNKRSKWKRKSTLIECSSAHTYFQ